MIFFIIVILIFIYVIFYYIIMKTKEELINYDYIDNIKLEDTAITNKPEPQLAGNEYPNEYSSSTASRISLDTNYVNNNIVMHSLHMGKRLKRMHDAKNSLVKRDWEKYFYTELKDNENSIWWEEQETLKDPMCY